MIQKSDSAGLSESVTANNLGLLSNRFDRNGTGFTYQYDEQNRLTVNSASANGITQMTKSTIGSDGIMFDEAASYVNGLETASVRTGMDTLKRVTSVTKSADSYLSSIGLSYDSNNRVRRLANNLSGFNVNYQYDRQRLDQVQLNGQADVNTTPSANVKYDYYAIGLVRSITYPALTDGSILKTTFIYDSVNRLTEVENRKGETLLSRYSYDYDANGNIIVKTEKINQVSQSWNYTYDVLNRLKKVTRPDGGTATYAYDLKGNVRFMTCLVEFREFPKPLEKLQLRALLKQ